MLDEKSSGAQNKSSAESNDQLYEALFWQTPWAGLVLDQTGMVMAGNEKATRLISLLPGKLSFKVHFPLWALFLEEEKDELNAYIERIFRKDELLAHDAHLKQNDNIIRVRLLGAKLADIKGKALIYIEDISYDQKSGQNLVTMAYYDQLTGLPNRYLLLDRLHFAIRDASRHGEKLAVMIIDLDYFKQINDSFGHQAGDELLQKISQRLASCLRESDTLARLGGDEFVVLLHHVPDSQHAALVAERILSVISKPLDIHSMPQVLGASIGICLFPDDATTVEELMERADIALYRSKKSGRNLYSFYNESMKAEVEKKIDTERRLRAACEKNELVLFYQPIISSDGQNIIALEALLRWKSEKEGVLPAAHFLPLAQTMGMDRQFADWALSSALSQMKDWLDAGLIGENHDCKLTVNLSEQQLLSKELTKEIARMIEKSRLPKDRLILEIRENDLLSDQKQVSENMRMLQDMSIQLYLDDFYHGLSTLSRLNPIPFSSIKIDQKLTKSFMSTEHGELLLASVIRLGHLFNLQIIAEGVENEEVKERLIRHGCDALQGYFICHPLPPAQVEMLLKIRASDQQAGR